MANDPTDPEYSLIQVNKTLSEIIVSICNCGISPKPWPVCTILECALITSQNFVSDLYLENKLTDFHQSLNMYL